MTDGTDPRRGYTPEEETTGEITEKIREAREEEIRESIRTKRLWNFEGTPEALIIKKREIEEELEGWKDFISEFVDNAIKNEAKTEDEHLNPMTGVLNRKGAERIFDLLKKEQVKKTDGGKMVSVRLDLDNFKKVNDLGDHALGDTLLKEIAEQLRHIDILIHFSGDEFGLILFDVKQAKKDSGEPFSHDETVKMLLSRIVDKIELVSQKVISEKEKEKPELKGLVVTASMGYKIISPKKDGDIDFAKADSLADDAASFSKNLKGVDLPAGKRIIGAEESRESVLEKLGITEADIVMSKFEGAINRPIGDVRNQLTKEGQEELDKIMAETTAKIRTAIEQNLSTQ